MLGKLPRNAQALLAILSVLLIILNVYYFFATRDISPFCYIQRLFSPPCDSILEPPVYNDLVEK